MIVHAGPADFAHAVQGAQPGDKIFLDAGTYGSIELRDIRAEDAERPIVIGGAGKAIFDGGIDLGAFIPRAEAVAAAAPGYPGVYPIAHEATLRLIGCRGLRFCGLQFIRSWPTAVYSENSSDLGFERVAVTGSSYAFYAHGRQSARLKLDDCHWLQDETRKHLWRDLYWANVHGRNEPRSGGARAYDGSFFNGFDIAGDVEIANCTAEHAFNGVHLFNQGLDPALARNIHVHHCTFSFIKDNPIETEGAAWNWWIHDNTIRNAHKWLSFEMFRAGYIYVFRNIGWFDDKPGPKWPIEEPNSGGGVFKLWDEDESRFGAYSGPIHVFNNSWYLRSPIAKTGILPHLHHHNNAVAYCKSAPYPQPAACDAASSIFGKFKDPGGASAHFTKDWRRWGIMFENDFIAHPDWPIALRSGGYADLQGVHANDPGFVAPQKGDFKLNGGDCIGKGRAVDVELPDGSMWRAPLPFNVGAWQSDPAVFAELTYRRLPDVVG